MKGLTLVRPHAGAPGLKAGVGGSIILHLALLAATWILPALFRPDVLILSAGPGGGPGGDTVRVGLTGSLDGGSGELFKPALKPEPPAVPAPVPVQTAKPVETPPQKDDFQVKAPKARRAAKALPPPAPSNNKTTAAVPSNQIPRETGPGTGGAGSAGGSGGGFGGGQGVHIGSGSGDEGVMESWYARQVEKRIGENWLRTNFESLAGKRLSTVIRFDILPDGRIDGVVIEQRSGVTFYDVAAERAIRSSTPLPRPPQEFQNRPIRFVCYFDYPPG